MVSFGEDRYGRTIGDVYRADELVNVALVRAGLAWWYRKYSPDDAMLRDAEEHSRELGTGLWKDSRHVAPWDWRKLSKALRDKMR